MYEDFYRLERAPFHITPDPDFLYLSPSHKEALASIVYGIEQRKGFVAVLGEVGLGKTTILRYYLDRYDAKRLTLAYVFNANVTFKSLLDTIHQELDIAVPSLTRAPGLSPLLAALVRDADKPDDVYEMVNRLHELVIEEYRQSRNVVLIVDEAQNMPIETLENLRMLSNLETSTDKLIQIVLVGQPEFADKLNLRELRQLKQRIAARCTLAPLTGAESLEYIEHRLNMAGSSSSFVFTRAGLRQIVKHARGIPRMLNILCDNALLTGFGYQKKPVTAAIVKEVIGDLEETARIPRHQWAWVSLVAAIVVMGAVLLAVPYRALLLSGADTEIGLPGLPPTRREADQSDGGLSPLPLPDDGGLAGASRPVVDAIAPQPPEQRLGVATRVVEEGDTLFRMATEVYGSASEDVLRRVVEHNPGMADVNWILVGTTIRFPDVSDLKQESLTPRQEVRMAQP